MIASTCQHLVSHMLHFVDEGAFSEPSFIGFFFKMNCYTEKG